MNRYFSTNLILFTTFHLIAFSIFLFPYKAEYLWLLVGTYFGRMFFVTAGYHRYFSHRTFKTSRLVQFVLAFFAMTSSQKGVLWWASHHRDHHRNSDNEKDIHSPNQGWLWSHIGWFLSSRYERTDLLKIKDFAQFPELVWLDRNWSVPVWIYGIGLFIAGGVPYLAWGFFLSTVLLWHGTFTINSLAHLWGARSYETKDLSRNNFLLSLITLGEGWHNNHHRFPKSCRNGIRWWEVDITFYVLWIFSWLGIVSGLQPVPSTGASQWAASKNGSS